MRLVLQLLTITETSSTVSDYNLYQYWYMPFGIQNTPATFQLFYMMFCVCRAYIDDIVVLSSSWENDCSHLTVVLRKLQDIRLTLITSKCEWGVATCTYLGLVVVAKETR